MRRRKLQSDIRLCFQDYRWEREGGEGRRRVGGGGKEGERIDRGMDGEDRMYLSMDG